MKEFTSATLDFNNEEFQQDLKRLNITATKVDESNPFGTEVYKYSGKEADLIALDEDYFHYEETLFDS